MAASAPAGLQAERTYLAWSRTSLAFAVNGILLLLRYETPGPGWLHWVAAAMAFVLLLLTVVMAMRRQWVLSHKPLPEPIADPRVLQVLGYGTLVLGITILILLLMV
ncbi:MAG TPA: DUF202 domain-containing protein [Salinisphaeraceae bacterium]|nr:DUF202 domain-containing protein [Salinisphaeraceae bacterium]